MKLDKVRIGYAMCGSFCTFEKCIEQLSVLAAEGADLTPIMSCTAYETDTRFGEAKLINEKIESICKNKIIHTITDAEPIGPKDMFDILAVAPCTGNTAAKLAAGIIDTPVTMAVKSHIRNSRPIVIAVATNDGLAGSAKNIGILMNYRNFFFVPFGQDDFSAKPRSLVSDFSLIPKTLELALDGVQLQPILIK